MEAGLDVVEVDRHLAWVEEPYTLALHIDGDITGENLRRMRAIMDVIGCGEGPIIILQDLSNAGAFTAEARKEVVNDPRTKRVRCVICIGASFQMRVFIGMISKLQKLMGTVGVPVLFAKTEVDARVLLASERAKLRNERVSG